MPPQDPYPSPPPSPPKIDPILRNALRYTISAKEYKTLHQYLISRTPPAVQERAPQPPRYASIVQTNNDFNTAAVRASLRVFVASQAGLKIWDLITTSILRRGRPQSRPKLKSPYLKSPNFRLSLSLSLILLLHRLLFRFFSRLRTNLLTKEAAPFRRRNPRISRSLTSRVAPAIGASLAGFALGVYPADQLRITIAIYVATRAAEFAYNALENDGWFQDRPWWWGSWMLMPLSTGQLLHAFVLDRDCFPKAYGDFILDHTPHYIQRRPTFYPANLSWPSTNTIIDSLAEMSRLNWPPFTSPILIPQGRSSLSPSLAPISPITSPASPLLTSLSCALLHPNSPSCLSVSITHHLSSFPPLLKFFTLFFSLLSLPRYAAFLARPSKELLSLAARVLRMTIFFTGAIGTSWGSICLFQHLLPRAFIPTQRWFLGGFLGGLWALVLDPAGARGNGLYSARVSVDSLWKVGRKRGWWKGVKGGDLCVLVAGMAVVSAVYDRDPKAVTDGVVRRVARGMKGEDGVDQTRADGGGGLVSGKGKRGEDGVGKEK